MYLIGTYFYAATPLIYRMFYARQNTMLPLLVNTGMVAACIPLYIIWARTYGAAGIALASSVCMALQFCLVYGLYTKMHKNPFALSTARNLAIIAAVAAVAAVACKGVSHACGPFFKATASPVLQSLTTVLVAGIPTLVCAMAILHLLRCIDIRNMVMALFRHANG
jgi:peptidoglycan biosynthesis protein MviN/MurJ (putative lipid II flippase)